MAFMEEFEHLKIQLEDIISATDNFGDNNVIGTGGFGNVYKGAISDSTVAIKRLDSRHGQGNAEFWKEIMMLSRYAHENLICLLGFCDERGEKILVYEHAFNGSLDRHLSSSDLTWTRRLNICLDAARGLSYLHDPKETWQRVLHRDIKSSNILLDENWKAKLSDLGLSKIGPANQLHTALVSNVVGTLGYLDPMYMEMGILTKESDVYSFGVVLFELLCGRLCFDQNSGRFRTLVRMWKQSYKHNNLDDIIFQDMKQQMDPGSLETFSNIAYQCLQKSHEQRPTMAQVVQKLEFALQLRENFEDMKQSKDYEEMVKTATPPLIYSSEVELRMLLSKGVLLNEGKTWFSLDKNGEHCELISAAACLTHIGNESDDDPYSCLPKQNGRFVVNDYEALPGLFMMHVRPQFLSPKVTYTINLVFKRVYQNRVLSEPSHAVLAYSLACERRCTVSYQSDRREDGWFMAELYQFTSTRRNVDLEIFFDGRYDFGDFDIVVEGIEFRPIEKAEHQVLEDEMEDMQVISDSDTDTYWEQKLPNDYEEILKWSKDSLQWTTKKELFSILCTGFLINNGKEWFSLAKNGKKCHMLPARMALENFEWKYYSLPESRFGEVAFDTNSQFSIVCEIKSHLVSPLTTYAGYFVYKFPKNRPGYKGPLILSNEKFNLWDHKTFDFQIIYLVRPEIPFLKLNSDQNTPKPLNTPKMKGIPQLRDDGWMEVKVGEFLTTITITTFVMRVELKTFNHMPITEVMVQGIEFRPI